MKKVIVMGGGGFIGNHLVSRLHKDGSYVVAVDLKYPECGNTKANEFIIGDLRNIEFVKKIITEDTDEIYQLAADMGGAGYIFTGDNDANVMYNSVLINLNVLNESVVKNVKKIFYSSSACVYPAYNQEDPNNPKCDELSAYPAAPDSEYGWEKLFSERLYFSYNRNYNIDIRVGRFHNIFGPLGTWTGGKEKAPAAICRKVSEAIDGETIEIWGDGKQTRSFLYIDDCIEAVIRFMNSNFKGPLNIGSEEMISINDFTKMIIEISGKNLKIKNIEGPVGVKGRNSDNKMIREKLNWEPKLSLKQGITETYFWIKEQVNKKTAS